MSTDSQTTAITRIDPRQATLKTLFEKSKGAIAQVLPKHMTAERILKVTLAATSRTPKLLECTQTSLLGSVMQAAQLGLEPGGPLGHAYLVPFSNKIENKWVTECQLIVGYRGLIDLARRSGQIDSIEARCVYERDKFKVSYGLDQRLEHEPFMEAEPGKLVCVYAIARIKGGLPQVEVMTRAQVDAIKAMSKTGSKGFGPWAEHYEEMARKTVVRRLCKYLPLTVEIADALEADDRAESEVDPGAFAAIPVEIHEEPLTEALKAKATGNGARSAPAIDPAELERWKMELQTAEGDEAALRQVFTNAQKALGRAPEIETLYLQLSAQAREPKQS